jgi:hypothetical protein
VEFDFNLVSESKVFALYGSARLTSLNVRVSFASGVDGLCGVAVSDKAITTPTALVTAAASNFAYGSSLATIVLDLDVPLTGFGTEVKRCNVGNPLPVVSILNYEGTSSKGSNIGIARLVMTFELSDALPIVIFS